MYVCVALYVCMHVSMHVYLSKSMFICAAIEFSLTFFLASLGSKKDSLVNGNVSNRGGGGGGGGGGVEFD